MLLASRKSESRGMLQWKVAYKQRVTEVACSENKAKFTESEIFDTPGGDGCPDKTLKDVTGAAKLLDCVCNQ
jgi:hypothetical protein